MIKEEFECRICGDISKKRYLVREMMFGLADQFVYWECEKCGCLQIEEYPSDLSLYYPENYYSFTKIDYNNYKFDGIKQMIKIKIILYNQLVFRNLLSHFGKKIGIPCKDQYKSLAMVHAKPWHKILDIGCGNARFLCELYKMGFTKLTGADKFIQDNFTLFDKIKVWKKEIHDIDEKFDIITMNHVFEHMPSQHSTMNDVYNILKKNGKVILRIPVKNEAWVRYKENWVQIDAPRHFYLHTIESIKLLAEQTGFTVE